LANPIYTTASSHAEAGHARSIPQPRTGTSVRAAPRGATIPRMADLNQIAHRIVRESTEPREPPTAAQVNGRNGGLKGGKARAEKLSPEERSEIARKAAQARWSG
jgi:hypothetical protein